MKRSRPSEPGPPAREGRPTASGGRKTGGGGGPARTQKEESPGKEPEKILSPATPEAEELGGDPGQKKSRIIAVGGGKGGVGKSVVAIALAAALAGRGNRVVLADLDLGGANLHTYLGMHASTPLGLQVDGPGVADFLLRRVEQLSDLLLDTPIPGVRLISGARFFPGMANPTHQAKLRLIRHLKGLDADVVILDLGAGVHLNTIDFFTLGRPGILVVAPEPGSVLNAYSFIKGGLFRHLSEIFYKNPDIAGILEEARLTGEDEHRFTVESFRATVARTDSSLVSLVEEAVGVLKPALIMNRVTDLVSAVFVDNLQKLLLRKLELRALYLGNVPELPGLSRHLLDLPQYLSSPAGRSLQTAMEEILADLDQHFSPPSPPPISDERELREDFSEDEIGVLAGLIDTLDEEAFRGTKRAAWRLRLYYRPVEAVRFLRKQGVDHPLFYRRKKS